MGYPYVATDLLAALASPPCVGFMGDVRCLDTLKVASSLGAVLTYDEHIRKLPSPSKGLKWVYDEGLVSPSLHHFINLDPDNTGKRREVFQAAMKHDGFEFTFDDLINIFPMGSYIGSECWSMLKEAYSLNRLKFEVAHVRDLSNDNPTRLTFLTEVYNIGVRLSYEELWACKQMGIDVTGIVEHSIDDGSLVPEAASWLLLCRTVSGGPSQSRICDF